MYDGKSASYGKGAFRKYGKIAGIKGENFIEKLFFFKIKIYLTLFRRILLNVESAKCFRVTAKAIYPLKTFWICYPYSANKRQGILKFSTLSKFTVSKRLM